MRTRSHGVALVAGLGVAQLLAWGSLYYAIAVIGQPMRTELGVSQSQLFGTFTWAMVLSGLLAPLAGKLLDRLGGRTVLAASAVTGALGFILLARAQSIADLVVAWSINGVAMALGLYDTCFAAIGQVEPERYRRLVTGVTLIAGFASTVAWPASHYLQRSWGWRPLCVAYAGALVLCALLYLAVLPRVAVRGSVHDASRRLPRPVVDAFARRRATLLALTFAGASLLGATLSAHLLSILDALGLAKDLAVWAAASVGVMQVLGRLLELTFGARHDATRLGFVTFAGLCAAMVLLLAVAAQPWAVIAFVAVYGSANGLLTIAKATLPVEMFGLEKLGALLGTFGAPSLVTRALAPLGFAALDDALGMHAALACMVGVGFATFAAYVATTRGLRLYTRAAQR